MENAINVSGNVSRMEVYERSIAMCEAIREERLNQDPELYAHARDTYGGWFGIVGSDAYKLEKPVVMKTPEGEIVIGYRATTFGFPAQQFGIPSVAIRVPESELERICEKYGISNRVTKLKGVLKQR